MLLDLMLDAPVDNSRTHLDCALDMCVPQQLRALSHCSRRLHRVVAPALQRAEQQSEAALCSHLGASREELITRGVVSWVKGLPDAQCLHLGVWLSVGGPLEGVSLLRLRSATQIEDEIEDEGYIELNLQGLRGNSNVVGFEFSDINDELMKILVHPLSSLTNLKSLFLQNNQISDVGVNTLTDACARGGMCNLETLCIDNPTGELQNACSSKGIKLNTWQSINTGASSLHLTKLEMPDLSIDLTSGHICSMSSPTEAAVAGGALGLLKRRHLGRIGLAMPDILPWLRCSAQGGHLATIRSLRRAHL